MSSQNTYRKIFTTSLPLTFTLIGETLVEVAGTHFMSQFGEVELGALLLGNATFLLTTVGFLGLIEAAQVLFACETGAGHPTETTKIFSQLAYLLAMSAVPLFLLMKLVSPYFFLVTVESAEIRQALDQFLRIAAFALFFRAGNLAFYGLYVGRSNTRILASSTYLALAIYLVSAYLLVYGTALSKPMGMAGAAWALLLSEIGSLSFLVLKTRNAMADYGIFRFSGWNPEWATKMLKLANPLILQNLVEKAGGFGFFLIIGTMGVFELAVSNLVYSVYLLLYIPVLGFSEVTSVMVSNLLGQNRPEKILSLVKKVRLAAYLLVAPLTIMGLATPEFLIGIFTDRADLVAGAVAPLRVVCLSFVVIVPGEIYVNAVTGTSNGQRTLQIELVTSCLGLFCTCFMVWVFRLPLSAVWSVGLLQWGLTYHLAFHALAKKLSMGPDATVIHGSASVCLFVALIGFATLELSLDFGL